MCSGILSFKNNGKPGIIMKEKIIAAIKAKFPQVNLSKKRLEAIAAKIETKVIDDETKIDAAIENYNDYNPLVELAKQDDTIRNLEAKLKAPKGETEEQRKTREEKEALEKVPDDTPAWAKALIEQNKQLSEGFAALQGEKVAQTMKQKATELLKEVPVSYWGKRTVPVKEEDIEAFVTEVTTDYAAFKQEMTNSGLGFLSKPNSGVQTGEKTKEVSPEVKAFMDKQAAAAKPAAAQA
jgi:hypothetical protein